MSDSLYLEAVERIERRLSQLRLPTVHALLFGFLASAVGLTSASASLVGVMNGVVYWVIFLWCLILLAHGTNSYLHSGAWKNHREKVIHEELVQIAYRDDLSPAELADLHQRLSDDIRQRAAPFHWTMGTIASYAGLWQGMFMVGLVINSVARETVETTNILTIVLQIIPLVGTVLLALGLVGANVLLQRKPENAAARAAYLHDLYNIKADKRKNAAGERLVINEEGEIMDDEEQKQARLPKEGVKL
jgi:hypothetical protein